MTVLAWLGAILGGIALVMAAALLWPMRVSVDVDERGFAGGGAWLGWGVRVDRRRREWELRFLGLRLARRPMRPDGDAEDKGDEADEEATEPDEKPARKARGWPLSTVSTVRLVRMAPLEVRRVARRVHVDRFRVRAVVATPDPAWTGELYGYGCAAASAARAWWPAAHIDLGVDFAAELPRGSVDMTVRARPVWLALAGVRVGWAYLRERRRSRRSR